MKYDVFIIGAATSGSYFAHKMAEKGYSVKVIERLSREKVGTKYDIFHIAKKDFDKHNIPKVKEGDGVWAFETHEGYTTSPYDTYRKCTIDNIVGLHMHEYTLLMNDWAVGVGAEIEYQAVFKEFIFDDGKIVGVKYQAGDEIKEVYARVVVDCSGLNAPVRRSLPDDYGIEKFELQDDDKFYVTLRYVYFKDPNFKIMANVGCPFYKTWVARQSDDPNGAILGIGSCHSYEYADPIFDDYIKSVRMPEFTITRYERGSTPYCRSPYSFVADGYIVSGDAGCLTKPMNGEGVTSSMVYMDVATDVLDGALKQDGYITKEKLWSINNRYNKVQGADFCGTRPLMIKIVNAKKSEFEFFFKYLPESLLQDAENIPGFKVPIKDFVKAGWGVLVGILTGKITSASLKLLVSGLKLSGKLKKLYLNFPSTPDGFGEWCKQADELWKKVGKMS